MIARRAQDIMCGDPLDPPITPKDSSQEPVVLLGGGSGEGGNGGEFTFEIAASRC